MDTLREIQTLWRRQLSRLSRRAQFSAATLGPGTSLKLHLRLGLRVAAINAFPNESHALHMAAAKGSPSAWERSLGAPGTL